MFKSELVVLLRANRSMSTLTHANLCIDLSVYRLEYVAVGSIKGRSVCAVNLKWSSNKKTKMNPKMLLLLQDNN
jgi:hypothetical protein